jgi:hypothetical protein
MNRSLLALSIASIGILSTPSMAQFTTPPPAGQSFMNCVTRVYLNPGNGNVIVASYVPVIDGLPGILFDGQPNEAGAYITWVVGPVLNLPIGNGDPTTPSGVNAVVLGGGQTLNMYYTDKPRNGPARTWADPTTFATGQLIATFRSTTGLQSATLTAANAITSYVITASYPFTFKGQTFDLRYLMPHGFAYHAFFNTIPTTPTYKDYSIVSAGGGTGIAIGGDWSAWPAYF